MKPPGDRILVIGPAWVGDMVMSHSLYRVLAGTRPGASIDVLAPAWSQPLLARMPEVRHGLTKRIDHGELALGRWSPCWPAFRADPVGGGRCDTACSTICAASTVRRCH